MYGRPSPSTRTPFPKPPFAVRFASVLTQTYCAPHFVLLADPFEAPQEPMFKLHDAMEIKLGMNKI